MEEEELPEEEEDELLFAKVSSLHFGVRIGFSSMMFSVYLRFLSSGPCDRDLQNHYYPAESLNSD